MTMASLYLMHSLTPCTRCLLVLQNLGVHIFMAEGVLKALVKPINLLSTFRNNCLNGCRRHRPALRLIAVCDVRVLTRVRWRTLLPAVNKCQALFS